MASWNIAVIGGGILFLVWCAFGPVDPDENTTLLQNVADLNDPREAIWTLGVAVLGSALVMIGMVGMIVPLAVNWFEF